ncbi:MAG: hypothetical protein ACI8W7_004268 [Gammaproteobacteria bacterium]|jgi:hypothetical protein
MVGALHEVSGLPVAQLVRAFGEDSHYQFAENYPASFHNASAKQLLLSVDEVIHVEVRKLYPDAVLPAFNYEDTHDSRLVMLYKSPRKLCHYAESQIGGIAKHFGVNIAQ